MEQCYSGGFIDELQDVHNLVISTAADAENVSYAGDTFPNFNEFCYEWTASVNWRYDDIFDETPDEIDADSDNNDICEIDEAHDWAENNDDSNDNPQLMDNSSIAGIINLNGDFLLPGEEEMDKKIMMSIINMLLNDDND